LVVKGNERKAEMPIKGKEFSSQVLAKGAEKGQGQKEAEGER
jgi:hypothetical protein